MRSISKRWAARIGAVALVGAGVGVIATTPAQAFVPASQSIQIAPGATGTITKSCGPSVADFVVSGGGLVASRLVRVFESFPSSNSAWTVSAVNNSANTETLWIRVVCGVSLQSYQVQPRAEFVAAGAVADAKATCAGGRTAMSGGWKFANASFGLIASRPSASNQWQVRARNGTGGTARMDSFVVCVGNIGLARHEGVDPVSVTIAPGGFSNPQRHCPNAWFNTGAAFNVTDDSGFLLMTGDLPTVNPSTTFDEWKFNFKNADTVSHTIQHSLICYGN